MLALLTVSFVESLAEPNDAPITAVPGPLLVANPLAAPIVATLESEEVHATPGVVLTFRVLPSLNVTRAASCEVVPFAMVLFAGWILIATTLAAFTLTDAVPEIEPEVAVIVEVPRPPPVIKPVLSIVATPATEELQRALAVRFLLEPSEYLPVAVNCCRVPNGMEGSEGVTAIDTNFTTGDVTVRTVWLLMLP